MMFFRRLMNALFGFKYVVFKYGYSTEIRRLRVGYGDREYVICYGDLLFLDNSRSYHNFTRII